MFHVGSQQDPSDIAASPISMRCPSCRHEATLDRLGNDRQLPAREGPGAVQWGARRCPNGECAALILYVRAPNGSVVAFPAETIDFDASDLPESVVRALEEAITCHANGCFTAAAIMVRKTLEVVCDDREATGSNLYERLQDLGDKVVLPQAMLRGLQNLRLLGNDAAHIESQVYNQVGREEVEVAIDVTKEILKATYQYESIMGRLDALKRHEDA